MIKSPLSAKLLNRLLSASQNASIDAGKILKENMRKDRSVKFKGKVNLVTEMDLRSEKLIVTRLRKELPSASFLTEEGSAAENDSEFKWVIDPLDGTTNYAHSLPIWCVSIALEYQGEIVLGCVYDPTRDELFTATTGLPAKMNGKVISVSRCGSLNRALLTTGFPYDIRTSRRNNLNYFCDFAVTAQAVRRGGSAALDLCYVAMGRFDGFWEIKLHPWDTAAGALIVTRAGGRVSTFDGKPFSIYCDNLIASNGLIHRQMMKVLQSTRTSKFEY